MAKLVKEHSESGYKIGYCSEEEGLSAIGLDSGERFEYPGA